jgi:hypothetical protein
MPNESFISMLDGIQSLEDVEDNSILFAVTSDCEVLVGTKKDFAAMDKENNVSSCTNEFYTTLAILIIKMMKHENCKELIMQLPIDKNLQISLSASLTTPNNVLTTKDTSYLQ